MMVRTLFWDAVEYAQSYRFYWSSQPSNQAFAGDNWVSLVGTEYTFDANAFDGPGNYSFSVASVIQGVVAAPYQNELWRSVEFMEPTIPPPTLPPLKWDKHMVHMCIGPVLNAVFTKGRELTADEWVILQSAVHNLYVGDPAAETPRRK